MKDKIRRERYFISVIDKDEKNVSCVGFVNDYLIAQRVIQVNSGNILDNAKYAVVEEVKDGIFMYDENPKFFEVVQDEEGRFKGEHISTPTKYLLKTGIGFGININK